MTRARDLDWAGTFNVRDLGGLPTRSGATTNRRAFVRSEHLGLLPAEGWSALQHHGVRTCVDLRSSWEISEPYADRAPGDVAVVWAPLEEGLLEDPEFRRSAESGELGTALYYGPYLDRWPERLAAVIQALAGCEAGGVLYHCQRGRDRTGLVTMALLSLADVPADVIVADHLHTDQRLVDRGLALGHVGLDGEAEQYRARGTTLEATVREVLDRLDGRSLLRGAGVSDRDLDAVHARLVGH